MGSKTNGSVCSILKEKKQIEWFETTIYSNFRAIPPSDNVFVAVIAFGMLFSTTKTNKHRSSSDCFILFQLQQQVKAGTIIIMCSHGIIKLPSSEIIVTILQQHSLISLQKLDGHTI